MNLGMLLAFFIIFLMFAGMIGLVVLVQYLRADSHRKTQRKVWGEIAQQRGGRLIEASGALSHVSLHIPGPGSGMTAQVANGIFVDGGLPKRIVNPGGWHTHVQADCMINSPSYVLFGHEYEKMSRLLPAHTAGWFRCLGDDAVVACGGKHVTVVIPGVVLTKQMLHAALEVTGTLATVWLGQGTEGW